MIPILRKAILRTVAEDQARLSAVRPTTRWAPWEPHRTPRLPCRSSHAPVGLRRASLANRGGNDGNNGGSGLRPSCSPCPPLTDGGP